MREPGEGAGARRQQRAAGGPARPAGGAGHGAAGSAAGGAARPAAACRRPGCSAAICGGAGARGWCREGIGLGLSTAAVHRTHQPRDVSSFFGMPLLLHFPPRSSGCEEWTSSWPRLVLCGYTFGSRTTSPSCASRWAGRSGLMWAVRAAGSCASRGRCQTGPHILHHAAAAHGAQRARVTAGGSHLPHSTAPHPPNHPPRPGSCRGRCRPPRPTRQRRAAPPRLRWRRCRPRMPTWPRSTHGWGWRAGQARACVLAVHALAHAPAGWHPALFCPHPCTPQVAQLLKRIDEAQAELLDVRGQVGPQPRGCATAASVP